MNPEQYRGALEQLGAADKAHLNGELLTHLQGTSALLQKWGCEEVLCTAGLFHAAYGTAGFDSELMAIEARQTLRDIIGERAEAIVYLYAVCDRKFVFEQLQANPPIVFKDRFTHAEYVLSDEQARAFCTLTVANELELVLTSPAFKAEHGKGLYQLFVRMDGYLPIVAIEDYQAALHEQS